MEKSFNKELGQLLSFIGRVATAIRLNSSYRPGYQDDNPHYSDDVMWLSDLLHHFERLGRALESGQPGEIIAACKGTDQSYLMYSKSDTGYRSEPAPTFERQKLFTVEEGRSILAAIMAKAEATD